MEKIDFIEKHLKENCNQYSEREKTIVRVSFDLGLAYKDHNPHPSDSDIKRYDMEGGAGYNTGRAFAVEDATGEWVKYEDYQRMRDRMNGEMCAFLEWAEENDYQRGGLPEKLWFKWEELKVIDIPYTTEQLLQKFRNR